MSHQIYPYKVESDLIEAYLTVGANISPGLFVRLEGDESTLYGQVIRLQSNPGSAAGMPVQQSVLLKVLDGTPSLCTRALTVVSAHEVATKKLTTPDYGLPEETLVFGKTLSAPFVSTVSRLGTLTHLRGDNIQSMQHALYQWIETLSPYYTLILIDPSGNFGTLEPAKSSTTQTGQEVTETSFHIREMVAAQHFCVSVEQLGIQTVIKKLLLQLPSGSSQGASRVISKSLSLLNEAGNVAGSVSLEEWKLSIERISHPLSLFLSDTLSQLIDMNLFCTSTTDPGNIETLLRILLTEEHDTQSSVLLLNLSHIPPLWRSDVYEFLCSYVGRLAPDIKPVFPILVYPEYYLSDFTAFYQQILEHSGSLSMLSTTDHMGYSVDNTLSVHQKGSPHHYCFELSGKLTCHIPVSLNATVALTNETSVEIPPPDRLSSHPEQSTLLSTNTVVTDRPEVSKISTNLHLEGQLESYGDISDEPENVSSVSGNRTFSEQDEPQSESIPSSLSNSSETDDMPLTSESTPQQEEEPDEPDNEIATPVDSHEALQGSTVNEADMLHIDIEPARDLDDQTLWPLDFSETVQGHDWTDLLLSADKLLHTTPHFLSSQELETLLSKEKREIPEIFKTVPVSDPDTLDFAEVDAHSDHPNSAGPFIEKHDNKKEPSEQELEVFNSDVSEEEHDDIGDVFSDDTSSQPITESLHFNDQTVLEEKDNAFLDAEPVKATQTDVPLAKTVELMPDETSRLYQPEVVSDGNADILDELFTQDSDDFNFDLDLVAQKPQKAQATPGVERSLSQMGHPSKEPEQNHHDALEFDFGNTDHTKAGKHYETERTEESTPLVVKRKEQLSSASSERFEAGRSVFHPKYGTGEVQKVIPTENGVILNIYFENMGKRLIDPALSPVEIR